jgi:hypothetical protein
MFPNLLDFRGRLPALLPVSLCLAAAVFLVFPSPLRANPLDRQQDPTLGGGDGRPEDWGHTLQPAGRPEDWDNPLRPAGHLLDWGDYRKPTGRPNDWGKALAPIPSDQKFPTAIRTQEGTPPYPLHHLTAVIFNQRLLFLLAVQLLNSLE